MRENLSKASRRLVIAVLLTAATPLPPWLHAETVAYRIDAGGSRVVIHVGKAGAFSFIAGHSHEVSGPIEGAIDVDAAEPSRSRLRLAISSSALQVSSAGEPAGDAPKVQAAMASDKVLDVQRYPRIIFESTGVTVKNRRGNALELNVTGQLTIRDVARPVDAPVRVELDAARLSAAGTFEIKQSAFGIKPVSVGGVVAVKDALGIDFSIVATR